LRALKFAFAICYIVNDVLFIPKFFSNALRRKILVPKKS
jgi:hypothetical protein